MKKVKASIVKMLRILAENPKLHIRPETSPFCMAWNYVGERKRFLGRRICVMKETALSAERDGFLERREGRYNSELVITKSGRRVVAQARKAVPA